MRAPPFEAELPALFTLMDAERARIDAVTAHAIVSRWLMEHITDWDTVYLEVADTLTSSSRICQAVDMLLQVWCVEDARQAFDLMFRRDAPPVDAYDFDQFFSFFRTNKDLLSVASVLTNVLVRVWTGPGQWRWEERIRRFFWPLEPDE